MGKSYNRLFICFLLCFFFLAKNNFTQAQNPILNQDMINKVLSGQIDINSLSTDQKKFINNYKEQQNGSDRNIGIDEKYQLVENDSLKKNATRASVDKNGLQTYGEGIFSSASVTDLTELSTPPLDYPIGVGDHIIVSLWGGAELQESYIVGKDGSIFPKGLGKIVVIGMTFEQMKSVVMSKFKSVTPSSTKISISLGQPRSINVNVVGNVTNPGPITVSAFSNAFNVIAKAGGITSFGNLRSIQIKRGGKVVDELDVYKYLLTGDFGKQIYLENNDFIIVGFYEKKVFATGQFKRPMYYQLKDNEGIVDLLKYSGGMTAEGVASIIKVIRVEKEKQVQRDINMNDPNVSNFKLQDGDIVKIDLIKSGLRNKVELKGEVRYPGIYELKQGEKLFDLINRAGGITENTYLKKAFVFKGAADSTNFSSERIELDLTKIESALADDSSNVLLGNNDVIQIFSKSEFNQQQYVEIFGEVRKPGQYRKYEKMTLRDLLFLSGGLTPSAEYGRVEVSTIIRVSNDLNFASVETQTVVNSYKINADLSLDSTSSNVIIHPFDQVFVRKNPAYEMQQNIELKGLVKYPGLYARRNKNERLSSFIDRAGGLTNNADISGAFLVRRQQKYLMEPEVVKPKVKLDSNGNVIKDSLPLQIKFKDDPVSIDLYKALKKKNSRFDIVLQENDLVFIPEINPFVSITGKVQSPVKVPFDSHNKRLKYYIDKAGGFGYKPWKRRVFVTYANGKSRRTKNFLFIHFYPRLAKGSVITVPEKTEGQDFGYVLKNTIISSIPVVLTAIIFKYIK